MLIKRYDRITHDGQIKRLHQEDFCQALGIVPEMKYRCEGGPTLSSCFQLVRRVSSVPVLDIKALLHGVLFNLIVGKNDAHGKNFSLTYDTHKTRLSPLYDIISTVCYPTLASKMAMKIGSKYDFNQLYPRHILQMADKAQLSRALIQKETERLIGKITAHITDSPFTETILKRAHTLLRRFQNA